MFPTERFIFLHGNDEAGMHHSVCPRARRPEISDRNMKRLANEVHYSHIDMFKIPQPNKTANCQIRCGNCSNCQLSEAGLFRSAHLQIFGMPNVLMWPNYHTQLFAEKTESTHWNLFCLPKCLRHVCDPQKSGQSQLALSNSNFATCYQIVTVVQIFVHPLHFLFSQM